MKNGLKKYNKMDFEILLIKHIKKQNFLHPVMSWHSAKNEVVFSVFFKLWTWRCKNNVRLFFTLSLFLNIGLAFHPQTWREKYIFGEKARKYSFSLNVGTCWTYNACIFFINFLPNRESRWQVAAVVYVFLLVLFRSTTF